MYGFYTIKGAVRWLFDFLTKLLTVLFIIKT